MLATVWQPSGLSHLGQYETLTNKEHASAEDNVQRNVQRSTVLSE